MTPWGGIICKHNARWHHVSRLKASAFCSLRKKTVVSKIYQLIAGISADILGVMEPRFNRILSYQIAKFESELFRFNCNMCLWFFSDRKHFFKYFFFSKKKKIPKSEMKGRQGKEIWIPQSLKPSQQDSGASFEKFLTIILRSVLMQGCLNCIKAI